MIAKVQTFIGEVVAEMKKVSWTTKRELIDSTLVVIFTSLLLGVIITGIDFIYSKGITQIIK